MKYGRKTVVFLGDGMADEPIASLDNRTPLEAAHTPGMDRIAREGRSGTLLTLPEGFPTSSEVANMTVLGCDLQSEYRGRGPLEAAGRGIPLGPNDVAFRLNLVNVTDGILRDFSGGHIATDDAAELIAALNDRLGTTEQRFYTGVSYRNLLVLSGDGVTAAVKADKPDDNHGERVSDHLPRAQSPEGNACGERRARRTTITVCDESENGTKAVGIRANGNLSTVLIELELPAELWLRGRDERIRTGPDRSRRRRGHAPDAMSCKTRVTNKATLS